MSLNFVAIDFETANRSPASACAVGLVRVRDGVPVEKDAWLIHPPAGHDHFEAFNVQLHGVSAERVKAAPRWEATLDRILQFSGDEVLVAHNAPFDLGVIAAASRASGLPVPALRYFCSLRLARKGYELPSYALPKAAAEAGYVLTNHHDALADAEACAAIVIDLAARLGHVDLDALSASTGVHIRTVEASNPDAVQGMIDDATF